MVLRYAVDPFHMLISLLNIVRSENLSRYYAYGVKADSLIENVVEKGPVGFIAVEDIAQTAFKAITDVESLPNREPILIGPELVSYQDVSSILHFSQ
jgi:uncharacterized protein YbjT (DUF2867 family)